VYMSVCYADINGYTGWPKSHDTEKKIEYLPYDLSKRANFFINDRGMLELYIHNDTHRESLC
jgi:hypothetical protein